MDFFNFGNEQTFHFFQWITTSSRIDHVGLIDEALARVETDVLFEMDVDVSTIVHRQLAQILKDRLDDEVIEWTVLHRLPVSSEGGGVDEFASSGDFDSADALFIPLIETAVYAIDCSAVALALLMQAGKWAPDRDRPEAI